MKRTNIPTYLLLACFFILAGACRKNSGSSLSAPEPVVQPDLTALVKELAAILKLLYQDPRIVQEVNIAIYCGYYEGDRVLLKDLLDPAASELYQNGLFRKYKVDTGIFRRTFCRILERKQFPLLREGLASLRTRTEGNTAGISGSGGLVEASLPSRNVHQRVGVQELAIHFPYPGNFSDMIKAGAGRNSPDCPQPLPSQDGAAAMALIPTIVYSTGEDHNAHSRKTVGRGAGTAVCYTTVEVDDPYMKAHPTHIISVGATPKQTWPVSPAALTLQVSVF